MVHVACSVQGQHAQCPKERCRPRLASGVCCCGLHGAEAGAGSPMRRAGAAHHTHVPWPVMAMHGHPCMNHQHHHIVVVLTCNPNHTILCTSCRPTQVRARLQGPHAAAERGPGGVAQAAVPRAPRGSAGLLPLQRAGQWWGSMVEPYLLCGSGVRQWWGSTVVLECLLGTLRRVPAARLPHLAHHTHAGAPLTTSFDAAPCLWGHLFGPTPCSPHHCSLS